MPDKKGWIGLPVFTLMIGSFFGFVLSRGELLFAAVGAVAFTLVGLAYAVLIGDNMTGVGDGGHHA